MWDFFVSPGAFSERGVGLTDFGADLWGVRG